MKKISISSDIRKQFAPVWHPEFQKLKAQFLVGEISSAELCADILERVWRDAFGAGFHNGSYPSQVLKNRLRFISVSVNQILERWHLGEVQLELMFDKPTPLEVLQYQAQGKRIVSLLIEPQEVLSFEEHGRDFAGFLIHDLVHAHHFFTSEEGEFERQVVFSGWMLESVRRGTWAELQKARPEMTEKFEYLMSDMNTHTWHLVKTLKSLLDQAQVPEIETQFLEVMGPELAKLWPSINSPLESLPLTTQFLAQMLAKAELTPELRMESTSFSKASRRVLPSVSLNSPEPSSLI